MFPYIFGLVVTCFDLNIYMWSMNVCENSKIIIINVGIATAAKA